MTEVPMFYDVNTDERRPITQADVDRMVTQQQALGCYIRGQDLLRAALHDVASQKMELGIFLQAIDAFERKLGFSGFRHTHYVRNDR